MPRTNFMLNVRITKNNFVISIYIFGFQILPTLSRKPCLIAMLMKLRKVLSVAHNVFIQIFCGKYTDIFISHRT